MYYNAYSILFITNCNCFALNNTYLNGGGDSQTVSETINGRPCICCVTLPTNIYIYIYRLYTAYYVSELNRSHMHT